MCVCVLRVHVCVPTRVCVWLLGGKRSPDVCWRGVCVLTLADGWCTWGTVGTAGGRVETVGITKKRNISRKTILLEERDKKSLFVPVFCWETRIQQTVFSHSDRSLIYVVILQLAKHGADIQLYATAKWLIQRLSDIKSEESLWIRLQTAIRSHLGHFSPQCQHTTAPPSFATSAWSHPLQHKHNIQETIPTARIISACNTTRLLSSRSPSKPPSLRPPSLKLLSNGPSRWPLTAGWRQITPGPWRALGFRSLAEIVAQAALTYLPGWWAFKWGELAALGGPSSPRPAIMDRGFLTSWKVTAAPSGFLSRPVIGYVNAKAEHGMSQGATISNTMMGTKLEYSLIRLTLGTVLCQMLHECGSGKLSLLLCHIIPHFGFVKCQIRSKQN